MPHSSRWRLSLVKTGSEPRSPGEGKRIRFSSALASADDPRTTNMAAMNNTTLAPQRIPHNNHSTLKPCRYRARSRPSRHQRDDRRGSDWRCVVTSSPGIEMMSWCFRSLDRFPNACHLVGSEVVHYTESQANTCRSMDWSSGVQGQLNQIAKPMKLPRNTRCSRRQVSKEEHSPLST